MSAGHDGSLTVLAGLISHWWVSTFLSVPQSVLAGLGVSWQNTTVLSWSHLWLKVGLSRSLEVSAGFKKFGGSQRILAGLGGCWQVLFGFGVYWKFSACLDRS